GGPSVLTAVVTDATVRSIGGVPVTFSTTKGTVTPATTATDSNGVATATLTTNATADVTATSGTASQKVTVNVSARSKVTISPGTGPFSAGSPVSFTVGVDAGANINNVHVDYGDGTGQDLGPISGSTTVQHNYRGPGSY